MRFDERSEAKGYLESVGQELYGTITDGMDEIELSTITKQSLYNVTLHPSELEKYLTKETIYKVVREGLYWQYYIKRMGKWTKA